jgi:hypothetical protein
MTDEIPTPPAPTYPDDYPQPPGFTNDQAIRVEGSTDPQTTHVEYSHPLANPEPPPEPGASNARASRDGVLSQEEIEARSSPPELRGFPPAVHLEPGESNARAVRGEEPAPEPTQR